MIFSLKVIFGILNSIPGKCCVEDVVVLLHHGVPVLVVSDNIPGAAGQHQVGQVRGRAEVTGRVEVHHGTLQLASLLLLGPEHDVALPQVSVADGGEPRPKVICWPPQRQEMLEHIGLDPPKLTDNLLRTRHEGKTVKVGVKMLGNQFLSNIGGEQIMGQPRILRLKICLDGHSVGEASGVQDCHTLNSSTDLCPL